MKYLCFVFFSFYFIAFCNGSKSWNQQRDVHTPRKYTLAEQKQVADVVNINKLEKILDPMLIPRVAGTPGATKVKKQIMSFLQNLGWTLDTDDFTDRTPYGDVKFSNIIATKNPKAARRLVLACHYDSKLNREQTFVTAVDSAVPCAMLLHIAKNLNDATSDSKDDVTIQLIFFDGEEAFVKWSDADSLYGSRHLAAKLEKIAYPPNNRRGTNELDRMDAFVLLDLLGASSPVFHKFFDETGDLYDLVVDIETNLASAKSLTNYNRRKPYFRPSAMHTGVQDDHLPFMKRGVPILHIIPVPFPDVWHKEEDNKQNLDFGVIENLTKIFQVFVAQYMKYSPDSIS